MGTFAIVALTVVVTLLLTVIILNLRSSERSINYHIECSYPADDAHFLHVMSHLLGPPIVGGNRITPLKNGNEIFPAMLEAIRGAQKSITFETYVYWTGEIGQAFADALGERAKAGVDVHVLLDFVGCQSMDQALIQQMEDAGCEVEHFHPLRWYSLARLNHRTHRKLLVIDGTFGFTGGVGIADEWNGNARHPKEFRDTHFKVEGPVVAQLQAAFTDNWLKTHSKVLHEDKYYPALEPVGNQIAQVFKSSPQEGSASARLMFMMSIAAARRKLMMACSYFVPDDLAVDALVEAVKRGVQVQIIVPGEHIDMRIVRRASRNRWGKLLEGGVEIYEYHRTMYHCKLMVVDDIWVSVGSANFDTRSFRLNEEANLNVLDTELAAELTKQMVEDLASCNKIELQAWKQRPAKEKGVEMLASLVRSQL